MGRYLLIASFMTCSSVGALSGCNSGGAENMQNECEALISPDDLPTGWMILPTSEMPPIDKTPWWTKNPQLLEGSAVRQVDLEGQPTRASRIWAVIYGKEDYRVAIFCFIYSTAEETSAEYRAVTRERPSPEEFFGVLKDRTDALMVMNLPSDCPDREFFVKHFEAVAKRGFPGP